MKIEIITLFPGYFDSVISQSIIGRGKEKALFDIKIIDLRDYTTDRHRTADDKPFGGGGGMVLKVEPLDACLKGLGHKKPGTPDDRILLTSAAGKLFNQQKAVELSLCQQVTIICGHYLGVDERILALYDIEELSVGDYVMTGGEPAAAVMLDTIVRLLPGVLGNFESALEDSHLEGLLGAPVYTRPDEYRGLKVPSELLSGDHKLIEKYRRQEAIRKTVQNRPELLKKADLGQDDLKFADRLRHENNK